MSLPKHFHKSVSDTTLSLHVAERFGTSIDGLGNEPERETIDNFVHDALARVYAQREQILEAFIAQTGCKPSECVQVLQNTPNGVIFYVKRRSE